MFAAPTVERFAFNFAIEDDAVTTNIETAAAACSDATNRSNNEAFMDAAGSHSTQPTLIPARVHSLSEAAALDPAADCEAVPLAPGVSLRKAGPRAAPSSLAPVTAHSDVVKHVYEGGLKLWECAVDLIQFLAANPRSVDTRRVLDLGCGHGLTGIYSLCYQNAQHVTFQDLNGEVLTDLTMRNVLANTDGASASSRCQFVSGDWCHPSLMSLLPAQSYSLILTSDTLYEPTSLDPLLSVLAHTLAADGVALVAAKRYYFGIGGGTVALQQRVAAIGVMDCTTESVIEDGKSNIREIVSLRWKQG